MQLRINQRRLLRRVHVLPSLLTLGNFVCGFFSIILCLNALFFLARSNDLLDGSEGKSNEVAAAAAMAITAADGRGKRGGAFSAQGKNAPAENGGESFLWACILIFIGMIFDTLDGKVARHMGAASAFGTELDSLADVTTFGVAPPILVNTLWISVMPGFTTWRTQGLLFGAIFATCAMLRLARYNIQSGAADRNFFSGLPSPAAAGCIVSAILLAEGDYAFLTVLYEWLSEIAGPGLNEVQAKANLLVLFMLVPGLLMVTTIPFTHFTNRYLAGRRSFATLVAAMLLFALVCYEPRIMLFVIFNGYLLMGILTAARKKWFTKKSGDRFLLLPPE
ncbi:MAG: CDP-alcohol phosphatidyltransferase family protein [Planctomycetes bacterium]|nr:CDP-alcohol phosphatidyltransferase family protein [Planctomycetota bacterium]